MSITCFRCGQRTGEDGICSLCAYERKNDRAVFLIIVGVLVAILSGLGLAKLWAVDWDVKCWVSDKCRKVP